MIPAPGWLIDLLRPKPVEAARSLYAEYVGRDGHAYALAAVRGELARMSAASPGTRNQTAYRVAARLVELCLADWAHLDYVEVQGAYLGACELANSDGDFLDGEAWSVWFSAERRVREPAALPTPDHLGTVMPWVDQSPGSAGTTGAAGFDQAGQDPASDVPAAQRVAAMLAADPFERDVALEMARIEIREEARSRVDAARFVRRWREPADHGNLAAELLLPDEPIAWRVGGLLPVEGNAVVIAPRKAGKTTLVGSLIKSLVDGDLFLGRFLVERPDGAVALFNYENTPRQQRTWLRELSLTNADQVHVLHLRGTALSLAVPAVRRYVVGWLRERGVKVWIPDPYARAGQGVILNENDNGQANVFTGLLDEIKAEAGVSEIIMPAHSSNKVEFESGTETSRGAGRLEDWADSLWYLTVADGMRFLRATGRDVEVDETQLHFDPATRHLGIGLAGRGRREVKLDADAADVSKVLQNWDEATAASQRQIESATGFASRRVAAAVKRLVDRGLAWTEDGPNRSKLHHHGSKPN